nr:ribose 5-phosphate isomerase, type A [Tanacetum cinerariifolium]
DHDLLYEVEINLADEYEQNLLTEAEIIDENGNILRTQKMTPNQVYKLKGGEKRRFCIPQGESVDKVLSAMFSVKRRTVKYRLKQGLYQQAANKLNEANGINGLDTQEKDYTNDELLAALDLLEPPENFLEHQWRVYKSHLRKPIAETFLDNVIRDIKQNGLGFLEIPLKALGFRPERIDSHYAERKQEMTKSIHTTGAVSFAQTKDIYKVDNKREPNDFESFHLCYKMNDFDSFHLCYKTKDDTYLQEATRDMMVIENREISSK